MPRNQQTPDTDFAASQFAGRVSAAWRLRAPIRDRGQVTAYRLLDGPGDGVPGIYIDLYGPAAVMNVYEDAGLREASVTLAAELLLDLLAPDVLEAVYVKPFARDRSRLGGQAPDETRAAIPRAGRPQPESIVVREYESSFEIRLFDGHSTGLFLDHREHRRALSRIPPRRALNLFSYTCGFAVPLAAAGAHVTNVDVSARCLEWGKRNFALSGLDPANARFFRMGAFEYLDWAARRHGEKFDLVIVDPPTFAAGDRRRGVKPWKARDDYPSLLRAVLRVLEPGGSVFAASNSRDLALPGALAQIVTGALAFEPRWKPLPPWPADVTESGRVTALCFTP